MVEYLKFVLHNQDKAVCVLFLFVLLQAKADLVLKERHSKKKLVKTLGSGINKVIFILLREVVAFYMKFTAIYFQGANFQKRVLRLLEGDESLSL